MIVPEMLVYLKPYKLTLQVGSTQNGVFKVEQLTSYNFYLGSSHTIHQESL